MFVKIPAGPSVFEKYLQIGPRPSKHSKNPQNPQKISKFRKSPVFCTKDHPTTPKNSRISLETPKNTLLPQKASKAHIFRSRAPFRMILASNFLEFITISYIHT
jgi:hypothetical protein